MIPPDPAAAGRLDRWLRELSRAVLWRRRLLCAGLLAGSMALALHALAPPPPPGVTVLVAARDISAGSALGGTDLRVASHPAGTVPDGSLTSTREALGRTVATAVRRGEVLTDARLVGRDGLHGLAAGLVATPVRVADAESTGLLQVGDVIDVLAAGATPGAASSQARLVASAAKVLAVPASARGGLRAPAGGTGEGALLVLATSTSTAARLAAAAVSDRVSIVLRGPGRTPPALPE